MGFTSERDFGSPDQLVLGVHPVSQEAYTISTLDRESGLYCIGVQGSGKSGLLLTLIFQDALAGKAIAVFDPHGDLVDDCLTQLPAWCLSKTYVLDLLDEAYPIGVNLVAVGPLTTSAEITQAVDRILHVFQLLWPETREQVGLPRYLTMAIHVLLRNPGSTLVDLYDFLIDDAVRARMLAHVTDPTITKFWAMQYDALTPSKRKSLVDPLLARLEALFVGRPIMRNVLGQKVTSINFRQAIKNGEIILIRLPKKQLNEDSKLVGTMLLAQLAADLFSYGDTPREQRPGVSLYVDECHNFCTEDFACLFAEGRKYGMRMTLAHQQRHQLPEYLQQSTLSAYTKVVFQVDTEDARELARVFPTAGKDRVEPTAQASAWLLKFGSDDPTLTFFTDHYLRPLLQYRKGKQVVIHESGFGWRELPFAMVDAFMSSRGGQPDITVPDPLPYLDDLLRKVMTSGKPRLAIPPEIPRGFANAGDFFALVRNLHPQDPRLLPHYDFPSYTEGSKGELLAFLATLRRVMVVVARQPIGPTRKGSRALEVAAALSQLPRRRAWVRSGTDIGVIDTLEVPDKVRGAELYRRWEMVRQQSRATYAYPREQVEAALNGLHTPSVALETPSSVPTAVPAYEELTDD